MERSIIKHEITYQTSRSGGSGGQHVNKVETKVSIRFDVDASVGLSDSEKHLVRKRLKNRINKDGTLVIDEQQSRSQQRNKRTVTDRFFTLLEKATRKTKRGKGAPKLRTNPRKRLESKRRHSEKKALRKKIRRQDL